MLKIWRGKRKKEIMNTRTSTNWNDAQNKTFTCLCQMNHWWNAKIPSSPTSSDAAWKEPHSFSFLRPSKQKTIFCNWNQNLFQFTSPMVTEKVSSSLSHSVYLLQVSGSSLLFVRSCSEFHSDMTRFMVTSCVIIPWGCFMHTSHHAPVAFLQYY